MSDAAQLELVRKALRSGLSNCIEWIDEKAYLRAKQELGAKGLSPKRIIQLLVQFAREGGQIDQRVETREEWRQRRDYWYRVVIPLEGFPRGLFIEIELRDDDSDVPMVSVVNVHRQRR